MHEMKNFQKKFSNLVKSAKLVDLFYHEDNDSVRRNEYNESMRKNEVDQSVRNIQSVRNDLSLMKTSKDENLKS
jgi:hypothetical protein